MTSITLALGLLVSRPRAGATAPLRTRPLITFTELFIGIAGNSLWKLIALIIFNIPPKPIAQDGVYHLRQAIYLEAAFKLLNMLLSWRKHIVRIGCFGGRKGDYYWVGAQKAGLRRVCNSPFNGMPSDITIFEVRDRCLGKPPL